MTVKFTASMQLHLLEGHVLPLLKAVVRGMNEDPGHSDLDDEQPIHVCISLGDYRKAKQLMYELEKL